jgi:hypothetical protein
MGKRGNANMQLHPFLEMLVVPLILHVYSSLRGEAYSKMRIREHLDFWLGLRVPGSRLC